MGTHAMPSQQCGLFVNYSPINSTISFLIILIFPSSLLNHIPILSPSLSPTYISINILIHTLTLTLVMIPSYIIVSYTFYILIIYSPETQRPMTHFKINNIKIKRKIKKN